MKPTFVAALCAVLCTGPGAALAQGEDDWEFQEDTARGIAVAAVRYDAGSAIIVQCREGALTAVMAGLPASAVGLNLQATRPDGRSDLQTWSPAGAAGAYRSTVPARDVRFMRGGGAFTVQTAEGETPTFRTVFDLPTQSDNLDRVLMACGWALTDDRDQLVRAGSEVTFQDPDGPSPREPRRGRGARPGRPEAPPPSATAAPVLPPAESQISCILRDLRLTDCRKDHPPTAASAEPRMARFLRALEGQRMFAPGGAVTEGRVIYPGGGGGALIVITRERLL